MLIVTTNDLPGMQIEKVLGLVSGSATMGMGVKGAMGASWSSMLGTRSKAAAVPSDEAERLAVEVMTARAKEMGATAILAVRVRTLDTAEKTVGVSVYGTAVKTRG